MIYKFKVGDIVTVRHDILTIPNKQPSFVQQMKPYIGKQVRISEILNHDRHHEVCDTKECYYIKEDNNEWQWGYWMFKPLNKNKRKIIL